MSASNNMTSDASGIEEITSGLTQTVLADDTVTTSPAVAPFTSPDEMDEIANSLGQAILGGNSDEDLATLQAEAEEAVEEENPEAELDPASAEEEDEIDALGAAWGSCSLGDDEEAKAQREVQQLQEKEEEDKRAAELAEEKREADEYEALQKAFREHGAKAHEIKRKERKEEAARQRRLEAEAEEISRAEQRAQEERRMQEAQAAQAKRDEDDRVQRNLAERNAIAIAQANAQEAHRQRLLYEAGLIAQHNEVVARQEQLAEQRRQQEQLFLQQHWAGQHQAYSKGELVAESTEEAIQEGVTFEGIEMDTALEMEASGLTKMDWEPVEETMPLLAEPPISSSLSMQPTIPLPEPVAEEPAPAAPAAPATVLRLSPRAVTPPLPHVAIQQLPQVATPPPPPAPVPAPAPSSPMTIKNVFQRATPSPTLAAHRPTINSRSPLGRLLSQRKSIPKAVLPQVLGTRVREGGEDGGPIKKKVKMDGELRLEVGSKRKREAEVFSGNKRVMLGWILGRALAVPGSRFAASPLIASPPTIARASTRPNAPPSPPPSPAPSPPLSPPSSPPPSSPPSTPSSQLPSTPSPQPPPVGQPLPVNPHRGLAEAIELFNDLPTLRAEIEWMRAQRKLNTSRKETRGKNYPSDKRTAPPASYWSKYRENPS